MFFAAKGACLPDEGSLIALFHNSERAEWKDFIFLFKIRFLFGAAALCLEHFIDLALTFNVAGDGLAPHLPHVVLSLLARHVLAELLVARVRDVLLSQGLLDVAEIESSQELVQRFIFLLKFDEELLRVASCLGAGARPDV